MTEVWAALAGHRGRAIVGTLLLHAGLLSVFLFWRPDFPAAPESEDQIITVEFITAPIEEVAEVVPEPEPEAPEVEKVQTVEQIEAPVVEETEPAPEFEQPETALVAELPEASGAIVATTGEDEEETEITPEAIPEFEIDPRYKVEVDPFHAAPPSALARVSRAVNCARVNRDTRPGFCPDYDEEDLYLAGLNRAANEFGSRQYDPVYSAAATRNLLRAFSGRQARALPTGGSEIAAVEFNAPVVPDDGCQVVSAITSPPDNLGIGGGVADTKVVHCD